MPTTTGRSQAATTPPAGYTAARLVLWSIQEHADDTGRCWPGLELLERETGLPGAVIHEATELLAFYGLITITEHASGNDVYQVVRA